MTARTQLAILALGSIAYIIIAFLSQHPQAVGTVAAQSQATTSPWTTIGLLAFYTIAILVIVMLMRKLKSGLMIYLIVASMLMIGIAAFDASVALGLQESLAFVVALVLVLIYLRFSRRLQLLFTLFIAIMLALVIGLSFTFLFAVLLLIFFSVFDYIAVRHSNYMINLAKLTLNSRIALPLILKVGENVPKDVNLRKSKGTFSILGAGDIVIPGILIASVHSPIGYALAAAACVGLGLDMLWAKREKGAIPALPIMAACMLAALTILLVI